ncbi:hypothetical protein [Tenacibaculum sp. 190130A14a]|uniref:hypothetical protein n=1 Tax=Tenacibaculum polynesiense TaxID=3137857 RepID=UPI0032B24CF6
MKKLNNFNDNIHVVILKLLVSTLLIIFFYRIEEVILRYVDRDYAQKIKISTWETRISHFSNTTQIMIKKQNRNRITELETIICLFQELWFHSNNCSQPIRHIWFPIQEVAKSTQKTRTEIKKRKES